MKNTLKIKNKIFNCKNVTCKLYYFYLETFNTRCPPQTTNKSKVSQLV